MQTKNERKENELLKKMFQNNSKTAVRVSDFLLDEVEKITDQRQEYVNIAILEKLARETKG